MEFTDNEISSITVELGIRKCNNYINQLENSEEIDNIDVKENGASLYIMSEDEARNVWIIKINHPQNTTINEKSVNKEYYVDATTKEVIGGKEL